MKKLLFLSLAIAVGLTGATVPACAMGRKDDQEGAREQMRDGKVLSLREIESRIVPRMRGMEYLGPEYDHNAFVYRLKFINAGRVIFVDVNARTGDILRQR
ncbi:PepSY domain-containing protein [Sphingorhabdus sp.]|jgi:uncharacterized membrane protein YkoI|uniref:PepSY domain-containing protein n=1 Tax=Sphingorhabdus sp. TaxID=1902408 RepID=UPI003BB183F6|nr:PepSY domain-containing protein [Sphingomonadales bacterium]MBK9432851.1 PepSY domain-containing protein [Sphingomonadales bacterium]MBL0021432.1 PepSY domain-containing protein [Sphingomonadales bacterium]